MTVADGFCLFLSFIHFFQGPDSPACVAVVCSSSSWLSFYFFFRINMRTRALWAFGFADAYECTKKTNSVQSIISDTFVSERV